MVNVTKSFWRKSTFPKIKISKRSFSDGRAHSFGENFQCKLCYAGLEGSDWLKNLE